MADDKVIAMQGMSSAARNKLLTCGKIEIPRSQHMLSPSPQTLISHGLTPVPSGSSDPIPPDIPARTMEQIAAISISPKRPLVEDDLHSLLAARTRDSYFSTAFTGSSMVSVQSEQNRKDDVVSLKTDFKRACCCMSLLAFLVLLLIAGIAIYAAVVAVPNLKDKENLKDQIEILEEQLNNTEGFCSGVQCVNGICHNLHDLQMGFCECHQGWTGETCNESPPTVPPPEEPSDNLAFDTLTVSWGSTGQGHALSWIVRYAETPGYPDVISSQTYNTSAILKPAKKQMRYQVSVSSVDWTGVTHELQVSQQLVAWHERELSVSWTAPGSQAGRGYEVRAQRLQPAVHGQSILPATALSVELTGLLPCTDYDVVIYIVFQGWGEIPYSRYQLSTGCEEASWRAGQSIIVSEWSGPRDGLLDSNYCDQEDNFPPPVVNPTCTHNEADGKVAEAIITTDSHTGDQCWHFKRALKATVGGNLPFSPELAYLAGRSDGDYIGDADGMYIRFWIKAANVTGDGSSIEIALANSVMDDRRSTVIYIDALQSGLTMITFDPVEDTEKYEDYILIPLADGLELSTWHKVEMTFRNYNRDYGDSWEFMIDDTYSHHTDTAYFEWYHLHRDGVYHHINRLRFRPRSSTQQQTGFLFDDVYYEVFNWKDRGNVLDSYKTSFEN